MAGKELSYDIVIIGSGPTGLGAATRLHEINHPSWIVLEAAPEAGGLASTIKDEAGFIWDLGVHQIFSHYDYFDKVMDRALKEDEWVHHVRAAYVWMRERFIPYPFQSNVWQLPAEDSLKCIEGLLDIYNKPPAGPPENFQEWILQKFGSGIADVFLVPYNKKVWAIDPKNMCTEWMGERVATVDVRKVIRNLVHQKEETNWGPNATFRYPLEGGTGKIWTRVAGLLPQDKYRFNCAVQRGCRRLPEKLKGKYWMYFPEDNTPTFRITVFSNYSPYNVPKPGQQWSLLCEVSESVDKPVNHDTIMDEVVQGLKNIGFLTDASVLASKWHYRLDHGYPTPFYGRNELVHQADAVLKPLGIMTRGRFGGWKYEVSNQDHSFMQGVEAVDFLLEGREELTFYKPDHVNTVRTR